MAGLSGDQLGRQKQMSQSGKRPSHERGHDYGSFDLALSQWNLALGPSRPLVHGDQLVRPPRVQVSS